MKKVISVLLIVIITLTLALPASASELTTADALTVLRAAAGVAELTPEQAARLGISGTPSTADALRILRVAAGLPANAPAARVGDIIKFGDYDWRVLHTEGGRALIMSEDHLGSKFYHNKCDTPGCQKMPHSQCTVTITWENSSLRAFLNNTFYSSFSAADRANIIEVTNLNLDNQWAGTPGGANTRDKIFLLSLDDVVRYLGNSGQLYDRPDPSAAFFQDVWMINDKFNDNRSLPVDGWSGMGWWLRSPGLDSNCAAYVALTGVIVVGGAHASHNANGWTPYVRPALWLDLSAVSTPPPPPPPPSSAATKTGDIVRFGGYDWRVLDVEGGKALLISDKILDAKAYTLHSGGFGGNPVTTTTIPDILNGEFYNSFNAADRARIVEVTNRTDSNPWWGGEILTSRDRIFLLSYEDVLKYFGDSGQKITQYLPINDQYNASRIAHLYHTIPFRLDDNSWWLRTPGIIDSKNSNMVVNGDGTINVQGVVHRIGISGYQYDGVRPAIWITL